MALGSTPSSQSFGRLLAFHSDEREVTSLKSQAQVYLKMYTRLEHLRHLASAMTLEGDSESSIEAVRLMRIAADLHLKNLPSNPSQIFWIPLV